MKKPSSTKSLVALLLFFCPYYLFAQSFFGVSSVPATDPGTNGGASATLAPPAGMAANYLVVVYAEYRANGATITMSTSGGQTWNTAVNNNSPAGTNQTESVFWCNFNGTWG